MATPALHVLPTEMLHHISRYLDEEDRHDFRLVSRHLAHQLYPTMPTEKSLYANRSDSLKLFVAMTEPGQPGCKITKLSLKEVIGTGGYMEEPDDDHISYVEDNADLLSQAFSNLKTNSESGTLQELHLACVWRGDADENCETPGISSGDLFERVAQALDESKLCIVKNFTVGRLNEKYFVLGCDRLETVLGYYDLSESLKDLYSLKLHFAPTEESVHVRETKMGKSYHLDASYYKSVVDLIKMCPRLMHLHLQGYHAWGAARVSLLAQIQKECPMPRLRAVEFNGIGTRDGEVADFLRPMTTLRWLCLRALLLTTAELKDIFRLVQTNFPRLDHLLLNNLEETGPKDPEFLTTRKYLKSHNHIDLVYFDGPDDDSHFPHNSMDGPNSLVREGKDARANVGKKELVPAAGTIYSDEWDDWLRKWQKWYGSFP